MLSSTKQTANSPTGAAVGNALGTTLLKGAQSFMTTGWGFLFPSSCLCGDENCAGCTAPPKDSGETESDDTNVAQEQPPPWGCPPSHNDEEESEPENLTSGDESSGFVTVSEMDESETSSSESDSDVVADDETTDDDEPPLMEFALPAHQATKGNYPLFKGPEKRAETKSKVVGATSPSNPSSTDDEETEELSKIQKSVNAKPDAWSQAKPTLTDKQLKAERDSQRVKRKAKVESILKKYEGQPAFVASKESIDGKTIGEILKPTPIKVCYSFKKGNCKYGDECKFSHAAASSDSDSSSSSSSSSSSDSSDSSEDDGLGESRQIRSVLRLKHPGTGLVGGNVNRTLVPTEWDTFEVPEFVLVGGARMPFEDAAWDPLMSYETSEANYVVLPATLVSEQTAWWIGRKSDDWDNSIHYARTQISKLDLTHGEQELAMRWVPYLGYKNALQGSLGVDSTVRNKRHLSYRQRNLGLAALSAVFALAVLIVVSGPQLALFRPWTPSRVPVFTIPGFTITENPDYDIFNEFLSWDPWTISYQKITVPWEMCEIWTRPGLRNVALRFVGGPGRWSDLFECGPEPFSWRKLWHWPELASEHVRSGETAKLILEFFMTCLRMVTKYAGPVELNMAIEAVWKNTPYKDYVKRITTDVVLNLVDCLVSYVGLAILFGVWVGYGSSRRSQLKWAARHDAMRNAVLEELFKMFLTLALHGVEQAIYGIRPVSHFNALFMGFVFGVIEAHHSYGGLGELRTNAIRVVMHVVLAMLPFRYAVLIHVIFTVHVVPLDFIMSPAIRKFYSSRFRVYLASNVLPDKTVKMRKGAAVKACDPALVKVFKDAERRTACQVACGFEVKGYRPVVYAANSNNEEAALYARVLKETPKVDKAEMKQFVSWVKHNYDDLFPRFGKVAPMDFDKWIEGSNASPRVKEMLRQAEVDCNKEGISWESVLKPSTAHDWTLRKAFVKVENNNYRSPRGRKMKATRLIQGAKPKFVVKTGPWFAAAQGRLKKVWSGRFPILFTSGKTASECAEHVTEDPVSEEWKVLEDDIGAFDASISQEICELEVWLARRMGAPPIVIQLMRANIKTHGVTGSGWKYKVKGTRKSGDPWTSFFNSIINGLMKVYTLCRCAGLSVEESFKVMRMVVQGDDNLTRLHPSVPQAAWENIMSKLGFKSECIARESMLDAEFCSNRFLRLSDGTWTMAPKAGKVLSKLGFFINPPAVEAESLMRGVALGNLAACSTVRPLRRVMEHIIELTQGHEAVYSEFYGSKEWQVKYRMEDDSEESFLDFCHQYQWSYSLQKEFEKDLASLKLGDITASPTFRHLCDVDTAGPNDIFFDPPPIPFGNKAMRVHPRFLNKMALVITLMLGLVVCVIGHLNPECSTTLTSYDSEDCCTTGVVRSGMSADCSVDHGTHAHNQENKVELSPWGDPENYPGQSDTRAELHRWLDTQTLLLTGETGGAYATMTKSHKKQPQHKKAKKEVVIVKTPKVMAIKGKGDYRGTKFTSVRGRGDYASDIGGFIGNTVGGLASKGIGLLGSGLKSIFGLGDYRVPRVNSSLKHFLKGQGGLHEASSFPMNMGAMDAQFNGGPTIVAHREFIGPILATGSSDFSTQTFPINPGRSGGDTLFPWASSIAVAFEQWEALGMVLEFKSTSSEFSSQVGLGCVVMSTIYDANSIPFASLDEALNSEYATTDKPSNTFIHPIECAPSENPITLRYVRPNNSETLSSDERFDDLGLFQISISGIPSTVPAGTELGQLWCTFETKFCKPKMPQRKNGTSYYANGFWGSTGTSFPALLNSFVPNIENSLPAVRIDSQTLEMPPGYHGNFILIMQYSCNAGFTFLSTPSVVGFGPDITLINLFTGSPTTLGAASASVSKGENAVYMLSFTTKATKTANNRFTFSQGTLSGNTAVGASFFVLPVDDDVHSSLAKVMKKHRLRSIPDGKQLYQDIEPFSRGGVLPAAAAHRIHTINQNVIDDLLGEKTVNPPTLTDTSRMLAGLGMRSCLTTQPMASASSSSSHSSSGPSRLVSYEGWDVLAEQGEVEADVVLSAQQLREILGRSTQ